MRRLTSMRTVLVAAIAASMMVITALNVTGWLNHLNGVAPSISGSNGTFSIDIGFDVRDRYVVCTIDPNNYADARNATCTAGTRWDELSASEIIDVEITDPDNANQLAEFVLLVM